MDIKQALTAPIRRSGSDEPDPPPPCSEQEEQHQKQVEESLIKRASALNLDDTFGRRSQSNTPAPDDAWVHLIS